MNRKGVRILKKRETLDYWCGFSDKRIASENFIKKLNKNPKISATDRVDAYFKAQKIIKETKGISIDELENKLNNILKNAERVSIKSSEDILNEGLMADIDDMIIKMNNKKRRVKYLLFLLLDDDGASGHLLCRALQALPSVFPELLCRV